MLDLLERQLEVGGDLGGGRLARELRAKLPLRAVDLVQLLDDVHRHADRPPLVGDRTRDGLPDPPRRVGRELVALAPVELLGGTDEPDRPLLDQVEERETLVAVALRDRDDEAEVRLHHRLLRRVVSLLDPLRELDLLGGGEERHLADVLQEELERVGRDLRLGVPLLLTLGLGRLDDDLDLLLVERGVERVDLLGVEVELVEGERELVGVDASLGAASLHQRRRLAAKGQGIIGRRNRLWGSRASLRTTPSVACPDTVAISLPSRQRIRPSGQTPALPELGEVALRLAGQGRARLRLGGAHELRSSPPSPRPTRGAGGRGGTAPSPRFGNRRVSGPSRENASTGRALSNRPTAAATCASTSSGASFAAASNSRTAETLPPEPLQRDAVEELPVRRPSRRLPEHVELGGRRAGRRDPPASGTVGDEERDAAGEVGMEQVAGGDRVRGVRLRRAPPPAMRRSAPSRPAQKSATPRWSWTTALLGVKPGEPIESVDGPDRPGGERLPDTRLERVESRELPTGGDPAAVRVQPCGAPERDGLGVGPDTELERQAEARPDAA